MEILTCLIPRDEADLIEAVEMEMDDAAGDYAGDGNDLGSADEGTAENGLVNLRFEEEGGDQHDDLTDMVGQSNFFTENHPRIRANRYVCSLLKKNLVTFDERCLLCVYLLRYSPLVKNEFACLSSCHQTIFQQCTNIV